MSLTIESTRFGTVEIADEAVLEFPAGLIGIPGARYTIVAAEEDAVFAWLHSLDDPGFAIPVTSPYRFFPDYRLRLSESERQRTGDIDLEEADVWVTVRAAERPEDFRANLRAPIVVAGGRGFQLINEADDAPVRAPLFELVHEQVA